MPNDPLVVKGWAVKWRRPAIGALCLIALAGYAFRPKRTVQITGKVVDSGYEEAYFGDWRLCIVTIWKNHWVKLEGDERRHYVNDRDYCRGYFSEMDSHDSWTGWEVSRTDYAVQVFFTNDWQWDFAL